MNWRYNCTKDLFTFCEEIKKVRATNKFLISYVCSLFTSILLKKTIDIAVNLLFEHNTDFKITKNELKKLFNFATSGTQFLFDGSFYGQLLQVFKDCEIILYRGYVDDIICLFNSESGADKFYEFLNKQHPYINLHLKNNKIIKFLF